MNEYLAQQLQDPNYPFIGGGELSLAIADMRLWFAAAVAEESPPILKTYRAVAGSTSGTAFQVANPTIQFLSGASVGTNGRWRTVQWNRTTAILLVVFDEEALTALGTGGSFVSPDLNLRIQPRCVDISGTGVLSLTADGTALSGDIVLEEGSNTVLRPSKSVRGYDLEFEAIAGAGAGRYEVDCGDNQSPVRTINGVTADNLGNISLVADDCLYLSSESENEINLTNVCEPCLPCDSVAAVARLLEDSSESLRIMAARYGDAGSDGVLTAYNRIRDAVVQLDEALDEPQAFMRVDRNGDTTGSVQITVFAGNKTLVADGPTPSVDVSLSYREGSAGGTNIGTEVDIVPYTSFRKLPREAWEQVGDTAFESPFETSVSFDRGDAGAFTWAFEFAREDATPADVVIYVVVDVTFRVVDPVTGAVTTPTVSLNKAVTLAETEPPPP